MAAATTTIAAAAAHSAATQAATVVTAAAATSFDNTLTPSKSTATLNKAAAAAAVVTTTDTEPAALIMALPHFARAPLIAAHSRARGLMDAARGNARVGMTVRRRTGGGKGTILSYVDARGKLHGDNPAVGDSTVKNESETDPLKRAPCTALVRWDATGATCNCAIGYTSTKHKWKSAAKSIRKDDAWDSLLTSPKKKPVMQAQAFDLIGSVSEPVTAP